MTCTVQSGVLVGINALPIQVEVDLLRRLPSISIVGLAGSAVRESADRVRSALAQGGFAFPRKRVVINLAPAALKKSGASFDLPIALGILAAGERLNPMVLNNKMFVGELSLSGKLRPIKGALSVAILAHKEGCTHIFLPQENAAMAALVSGIKVVPVETLTQLVEQLEKNQYPIAKSNPHCPVAKPTVDLSEVRGQKTARIALEVAAAGGHNLLLVGPPGSGKTMLAQRLPTILPPLTHREVVEITQIHTTVGNCNHLIWERPFRAPHHSISMAGMNGNAHLHPGEASLAHNGVLFLDELPEFRRDVLESLRTPLEERIIRLVRMRGTVQFPACFSLIAASNPCPCGFWGHPSRPCYCTPIQRHKYQNKLSGPLRDRIDLQINVDPVAPTDLAEKRTGESSITVRHRVATARKTQIERYQGKYHNNAQLAGEDIPKYVKASPRGLKRLNDYLSKHGLSGRSWARILKVSRTIADLKNDSTVKEEHIIQAISLRSWGEI